MWRKPWRLTLIDAGKKTGNEIFQNGFEKLWSPEGKMEVIDLIRK